ncbi:MAG: DnaD domain protein, partial [Candidatus Bathyarchaeota archaeon]
MARKSFSGFPERMEVTPIPTLFLTALMPHIDDIAELKVVLHIFRLLSQRRGYPRFVTLAELLQDNILISGIAGDEVKSANAVIRQALDLAVQQGILLHLKIDKDGKSEGIYLINSDTEKKTIDKIQHGELTLSGLTFLKQEITEASRFPDIFSLYEQNIGILTPLIAEELQEAEKLYPAEWIESAFKEAVALNKRSWKYIARILERWTVE